MFERRSILKNHISVSMLDFGGISYIYKCHVMSIKPLNHTLPVTYNDLCFEFYVSNWPTRFTRSCYPYLQPSKESAWNTVFLRIIKPKSDPLGECVHVHLLQTCLIWHSSKSSKDWTSRDGLFRDSWQDTAATLRLSYSPRALQIWECGSPNNPWIKMLPRYWWEQRSAALSVSVSHCMMLLDAFGPSCHFIEWAINNMSFSNGEHHKNNLHKTLLFVAQMACWPSASRQPELN